MKQVFWKGISKTKQPKNWWPLYFEDLAESSLQVIEFIGGGAGVTLLGTQTNSQRNLTKKTLQHWNLAWQ